MLDSITRFIHNITSAQQHTARQLHGVRPPSCAARDNSKMGNEISTPTGVRADEVVLLRAVLASDVSSMQTLLQQKPALIHAHSKVRVYGVRVWQRVTVLVSL